MENLTDWATSPAIKRVIKRQNSSEDALSKDRVYSRAWKFLIPFVLGVILAIVLHQVSPKIAFDSAEDLNIVFSFGYAEIITLSISLFVAIITGVLATIFVDLSGVLGSICIACYGYDLGFLGVAIPEYQAPILLALALTIALVSSLVFLYNSKVIRVTNTFRKIVYASILSLLLGGLLMFILSLIPSTSVIVVLFYTNPAITILLSVLGVVLACMFLICDFDAIERAENAGVDRKFETYLAFNLAFSVVWLYFKVLDLVLTLARRD